MRNVVRKLTMALRAVNKSDPFPTTQEVGEELNIDNFTVIWYLRQIGKVEKLDKWVPCELTENKKNCHFEVSSYSRQQE